MYNLKILTFGGYLYAFPKPQVLFVKHLKSPLHLLKTQSSNALRIKENKRGSEKGSWSLLAVCSSYAVK